LKLIIFLLAACAAHGQVPVLSSYGMRAEPLHAAKITGGAAGLPLMLVQPSGTIDSTTWNSIGSGTVFAINSPYGTGITPFDIRLDGNSVFYISQYGSITASGNLSVSGSLNVPRIGIDYSVAFTISGCSASVGTNSRSTGGTIVSGTTGTCTVTITMGGSQSAADGWLCYGSNQTTAYTNANQVPRQKSSTSTTAVLEMNTTSGDVIEFACISK
jgi:hypothetical protein